MKKCKCPKCEQVLEETAEKRVYYCSFCDAIFYRGSKTFQRVTYGLWEYDFADEHLSLEISPDNDYLVRTND